jgi:predicted permease
MVVTSLFSTTVADARYALRTLRATPGFTAIALLSIALGIGANVAIFSVIDAVLLRPVPGIEDPESVVQVTSDAVSYPTYEDLRDGARSFDGGLAAHRTRQMSLRTTTGAELVGGSIVTGNLFGVLGARAHIGRMLGPADDDPVAPSTAVLGYAVWRRVFGADSAIVGQTIHLNGAPFTVVGIASAEFRGLQLLSPPDVWITVNAWPRAATGELAGLSIDRRSWSWLTAVGRLRDGGTIGEARGEMQALADREAQLRQVDADVDRRVELMPAAMSAAGPGADNDATALLLLLLAAVGLALLIACANVANLLLARATKRRAEIGVRLAFGAAPQRILRQVLAESLVLALGGGAAAVVAAIWTLDLLSGITLPADLTVTGLEIGVNARVLLFALGLSTLSGLLFGMAPAIRSARTDVLDALRTRAVGTPNAGLLRGGLVAAQVALCTILLVGAGLFVRSLSAAREADLGFDPDPVAAFTVNPGLQRYDAERARVYFAEATRRLLEHSSIRAAAWASSIPFSFDETSLTFDAPGRIVPDDSRSVGVNVVGSGWFSTMSIPLLTGRAFEPRDAENAFAIVNRTLGSRVFGTDDPVGAAIDVGGTRYTIVGVAADSKYYRHDEPAMPFVYLSTLDDVSLGTMNLLVRTDGNPAAVLDPGAAILREIDPGLPLSGNSTLASMFGLILLPQRLAAALFTVFGILTLVLATAGVYGVVSYVSNERTREFGIRFALGATGIDVMRNVVSLGLTPVGIGIAGGIVGSVAFAGFARGFLFGVDPLDPIAFAGGVAILGLAAIIAGVVPASRAARTDPIVAIRVD